MNERLNRIEVLSNDEREFRELNKFPGLLKDGLYFFIPLKLQVAFNLVHRLIKTFPKKVSIEDKVMVFINQPFKLKKLPPSLKLYTQPKDYQEIALRYLYTAGGGGLLLEPGMGKTKVILDYIALMEFTKSLIVCPLALLFVWEDETKIHRPDKKVYCVKTTAWEEELPKIKEAEVVVVNYDKAVSLADKLVDVGFNFLGIDEGLIKDPKSGRTKALTWLGRRIQHKTIMSGTLVNNTPLDVFAPLRFLESGLVGNSYTDFKNRYTIQVGPIHKRFVVGYKDEDEIRSILESTSIVMTKDKWLKLPPKKFIDLWVEPSEEQKRASAELQSNYITKIQDKVVEVNNPLTVLCKLIQIANGFVYINSDEKEINEIDDTEYKRVKRETIYFLEQPKINKLVEVLTGQLKGRRSIIWYNMNGEYELLSKTLKDQNFKWLSIRGGSGADRTADTIRTYNSDPSYDYLVCQSKAVNYGVTLLGKDYEESYIPLLTGLRPEIFTQIFYSLNFSLETYLQQQDRIHRLGQEFECEYYRLFTNTPAEKHIKEKIDEKQSIKGRILQDIISSLGIRTVL